MVAAGDFGFKCFVGVGIQARDAPVPFFDLREQFRKFAITGRAAHQADPRGALENFFAFLLRHAAEHTDDFPGVLSGLELPQTGKDFLRRLLANAAGVIEDDLGGVG